ncbi:MAG: MerR family transcriptional regulator, partial [Acidobacteria bacterium]|nr:MerR family transcriptional regulator [Acidobacteriota bacterium]
MGHTAPIEERFSRRQVLRILGISERRISAWERQGFIQPSGPLPTGAAGSGGEDRRYSFADLVALKKLWQLQRSGIPLSWMRSL